MKKLIILILLLYLPYHASALNMALLTGGGTSYIATETFETSEYDNATCGTPICVTENDQTCDGDTDTTGLDMVGDKCLTVGGDALGQWWLDFGNYNEIYITVKFRYNDNPVADVIPFTINDSSDNPLCSIQVQPDENIYILAYGGSWVQHTNIAPDTSTYIRLRYTIGTGDNAACGISVWTGSEWATEYVSDDGTRTAQAYRLECQNNNDTILNYFDDIKVNNENIKNPE